MNKQFIFCTINLLLSVFINAQVIITVQLPPAGIVQNSQLWNITLANSESNPTFTYIQMTLNDASSGQTVLTAKSKTFTLNKGIVQLNENTLLPIQYSYLQGAAGSQGGFLPIGNYNACYGIYKVENELPILLSEDCLPIEVAPLSPPQLTMPEDEATSETPYPVFTWLPPAPLNLFSNLSYDLLVVEVLQGQNPIQAIQQNIPVYNIGNNKNLYSNYPASRKSLDTGKLYAWRIIAKNNSQFAAQSEVWTFKVKSNKSEVLNISANGYLKLIRGYEPGLAVTTGLLKIEYPNYLNDGSVNAVLKKLDNPGKPLNTFTLPLKAGSNYIDISLTANNRFEHSKTYLLELQNSAGETWTVKFVYKAE